MNWNSIFFFYQHFLIWVKDFSEFLMNSTPIGGPGHTMQIDELVVAKRPRFSNLPENVW